MIIAWIQNLPCHLFPFYWNSHGSQCHDLGKRIFLKWSWAARSQIWVFFLGRKHQGELQPFSKCERAFLEIHYTGHCLHCGIYTHLNIGQYFPAPLILAFRKLISPFYFGTFFIRFGNHKACKWKFQRCSLDLYCVQRDAAKRHNPFLTHLHFGISIQNPIFL